MQQQTESRTIVISVSSPHERDAYIRRIYANLTSEPSQTFTVVQNGINKVQVFHNASQDVRVLIRTYVVVIIPVMMDISVLKDFTGNLTFHLDETITALQAIIHSLSSMQGSRVVKASRSSVAKLDALLKSLS
jgi:ribonuclease D